MSDTTWATDEDAKEGKKLLRKMNKARNFPSQTCPYSRHTALMAECLIKDRRYEMLLEEPVHCGESLAVTVWLLWEARAALASKDAEIERLTEDVKLLEGALTDVSECLGYGHGRDKTWNIAVGALTTLRDRRVADIANRAAGATPHPRSEVSGSDIPGNRSGDPE